MKNLTMYLLSIGIAFFGGLKYPKKKVKPTVKIVKDKVCKSNLKKAKEANKECHEQIVGYHEQLKGYHEVIKEMHSSIKDLHATVEVCEMRYPQEEVEVERKPAIKVIETDIEKVLHPEKVEKLEPTME